MNYNYDEFNTDTYRRYGLQNPRHRIRHTHVYSIRCNAPIIGSDILYNIIYSIHSNLKFVMPVTIPVAVIDL